MICESGRDKPWRCIYREDKKWKEYGEFDGVVIEGKKVELPLASSKVEFNKGDCEVREEKGLKVLYCTNDGDNNK